MPDELCEMPLADAAALVRSKQISPVELTSRSIARIERLNPKLNAYITVTAELAMEQARAAEKEIANGNYRGPLHGMPIALKDLFYTRGVRTTAGSKILRDFVPDSDAAIAEKLRDAGAVLVGKTSLHEFAYGITNENPHYGPVRNPWDTARVSGGSSGGSGVAVATGMCFASVGTDTGGSIRIPSSFCGTAGLKPTFGRVSTRGAYPLAWTLDHIGPMARTVVDVGIVYQAIAGFDPADPRSVDRPLEPIELRKSLSGMRVGVAANYFFDAVQPDVAGLVRAAALAIEQCGAEVREVQIPEIVGLTAASRLALLVEAPVVHEENFPARAVDYGDDVRALLEKGRTVSAAEYVHAQLTRDAARAALQRLFESIDVFLTPATPLTAFPIGANTVRIAGQEEDARVASTRLLRAFNGSGHPALSVCCGFDSQGLPVGLQIVGGWWGESAVLRVGYAYEQATNWHQARPPMA